MINTKFIILTPGRSGSDLIGTSLLKHYGCLKIERECFSPNIDNIPKIMKRIIKENNLNFDNMNEIVSPKVLLNIFDRIDGFRVLYYHFINNKVPYFIFHVPYIKIIHIVRRNHLYRYVSLKHAIKYDIWKVNLNDKTPDNNLIDFDSKEFEKTTCMNLRDETYYDTLFCHKILKIYYEDLILNWGEEINRIQRFLGLPITSIKQTQKKIIRTDYENLVPEYNKWKKYYKNTTYEQYFV